MLAQLEWLSLAWHVIQGLAIIFIIWLVQAIINKFIKNKFAKNARLPQDAVNGVMYIIRVIFAFIILFVFLSYFGIIDAAATLNIAAVMSTAIGFSLTIAVGNFVAGLYLIASRPYAVGDYVRMGPIEGYVTEIGLNYTTIVDASTETMTRVPNRVAMNENLLVYKVPERKEGGKWSYLSLKQEHAERYTVFIESELAIPPRRTLDVLNEVCERWSGKFGGQAPRVRVKSMSFRVRLAVVITARDMHVIQDQLSGFLDDIWDSLHGTGGDHTG